MSKDWTGNKQSIFTCLGARNFAQHERETNDYYATEPKAVELLLAQERAAELAENLQGCLSRLERQVLGYYLDGWSYGQIAAALGKTPKAVDNAVQRIRAKAARMKMAETGDTRSQ